MKNNKERKNLFLGIVGITVLLFAFLLLINLIGIKKYNVNQNQLIETIIENVKEQYPNIEEIEIIKILNTKKLKKNESLKKYGITIENEEISLQNKILFNHLIVINSVVFLTYLFLVIFLFIHNNKKETKKIEQLTEYLMRINREDYHLDMLSNTEDEFSKLKNEIYKTAITLNEQQKCSLQDKEALKESISDISHQLKTPLTSITIMLDAIIDDKEMDEMVKKEFLNDIHKKINNINFLVQALLKLSRFDANTIKFDNKEIYIKEIIKEAVSNVSILAELKEIKIEVEGKNEKIVCDKKWQTEAITNILKNCIEHSKENDSITITYNTNKIYSFITIKDTGKGINEKDLPHIFERFYKGSNASGDSIGIGLALSKTIIEANDGSISVKSKIGKGTSFEIKYFKV